MLVQATQVIHMLRDAFGELLQALALGASLRQ